MKNPLLYLVVISLSISLSTCDSEPEQVINRPNILFIPVDDLRPNLGCYGDTVAITPHIDKLASEGVVFNRTYCQQAVCNPSRVSLLTGLRPDTLRVWDLRTEFRNTLPDLVTLPQYFKENGYYVYGIGKIFHNIYPDTVSWNEKPHIEGFPFDPDAVYLKEENITRQEEKKKEYMARGIDREDQLGHWYIKTVATECAEVDDDAYFDGAQTTAALKKMEQLAAADQPFFMAVGYYRPHLPFNAPAKYWELYDRNGIPLAENQSIPENMPEYAMNRGNELRSYEDMRDLPYPEGGSLDEERQRLLRHGYYASVSYIDAQIGRLVDKLKELRIFDNTIIIIWGDHGWKLGDYNAWCKQTNYEMDTRVPMIIAGNGVLAKGMTCDRLTEFVDIYPTLCDMAGLDVPAYLQGTSVTPLLEDPGLPWKNAAFSQFLQGRFGKMHPAHEGKQYMGYAVRTENYRYVEWYAWDSETNSRKDLTDRELYDLTNRSIEKSNIAAEPDYSQLVEEMSLKLKEGWRSARPPE